MKGTLRYRLGTGLIKILPNSLVLFLGRNFARIYSLFPTYKRKLVLKNLKRAGIESPSKAQARQAFISYANYYIDAARIVYLSTSEIEENFRVDGFERINEALAKEKGVILALPHMGSWEWAGAWLANKLKKEIVAIVEPFGTSDLQKWVYEYRKKMGIHIIPLSAFAGQHLVKALGENRIVCLLSDRYISGAKVETQFFGEKTVLPAGPAALSLRTGAPIIPACIFFKNKIHNAKVLPPIYPVRAGKFREDVTRVTVQLTGDLEKLIRIDPLQWHLMSPNWPSDFPEARQANKK